jgi:hypothetical protein
MDLIPPELWKQWRREAEKSLKEMRKRDAEFISRIPWYKEKKHMDMEMKKNLAVMAEQQWYKKFAFGPGIPALAIIDWLDEKGFLTDPTTKNAEPKKECATCGWDKAGICFGPMLCRSTVDRDEWKPKDFPAAKEADPATEGLLERAEWDDRRRRSIKNAIELNVYRGLEIPREWTDEFNELLRRTRG